MIDNASGDGSVEQMRALYPNVAVTELLTNEGYGAGMNAGIRAASDAGTLLLLAHDCVLAPSRPSREREALGLDARSSESGDVGRHGGPVDARRNVRNVHVSR